MEIKYQEIKLDDIIKFYVEGFDTSKIHSYKYFIDVNKNTAILKLTIKKEQDHKPNECKYCAKTLEFKEELSKYEDIYFCPKCKTEYVHDTEDNDWDELA